MNFNVLLNNTIQITKGMKECLFSLRKTQNNIDKEHDEHDIIQMHTLYALDYKRRLFDENRNHN